jgi:hypothetical protein
MSKGVDLYISFHFLDIYLHKNNSEIHHQK